MPWLPPAGTVVVPGRGEIFYRYHRHDDPTRPTLLLLHGWTATGDFQFFTAYRELAKRYSFVVVDHHGHGRGLRTPRPFLIDAVADDAVAVLDHLRIDWVVPVGYSMGGPIAMVLTRRHPDRVRALVVQATALEWSATRRDRAGWVAVRAVGPVIRSRTAARFMPRYLTNLVGSASSSRYVPWMVTESARNDLTVMAQAARAIARHDARPWASALGIPAASLITTADRLVPPHKQRALAAALSAEVIELAQDHLVTITHPEDYSLATLATLESVFRRLEGFEPVEPSL